MNIDSSFTPYSQPRLFKPGKTSSRVAELFPEIWSAAEDLCNPSNTTRRRAIALLEQSGAPRISPLIVYLVATRLVDPDMEIRAHVVKILGEVLSDDDEGSHSAQVVINQLTFYLADMRTRHVYSAIQVLTEHLELAPHVIRILSVCPFAGNHLIDVANLRKVGIEIRKQAIWLIGQIGYLDAVPSLERLQLRMESRLNGQQAMPFAPPAGIDDTDLLPAVRSSLALLRSP